MSVAQQNNFRFRHFVDRFTDVVQEADESIVLDLGKTLLRELVSIDDWLPEDLAEPSSATYSQYLLHLDPAIRFCVVAFVWQPGQGTPIHNHTVWGLVGVLRGSELAQRYEIGAIGRPQPIGRPIRMNPGDVEALSPTIGDIHQVQNALDDRVSISIHVYGGDIGTISRSTFSPSGLREQFVSGYSRPNT